jgi:ABC-type Zn uptake system ZnuABC Zn-binding protein ZnuA
MSLLENFTKASVETYTKSISYAEKIPTGLTVSSVAVSSIDLQDGESASVATAAAGDGVAVEFTVTGGVDGHEYLITLTSTLSDGTIISDQITMSVIDRAS